MFILIVVFSLVLLLNIFFDYWLITGEDVWINHTKSFLVWLFIYAGLTGLMHAYMGVSLTDIGRVSIVWPSVRWIAHDLGLNAVRGKKWDYLGNTEKAALTDKLLRRLPFHFIWVKVGIFFKSLAISIILPN